MKNFKTLKTRVISFSLAASMTLSMLPATAWAAGASNTYGGRLAAHDCSGTPVTASSFAALKDYLDDSGDLDIIITGDISVTGVMDVVGTKHVYAESEKTYTLKRDPDFTGVMFNVNDSSATLVLGNGVAEYDTSLSSSDDPAVQLAAAGQEGAYEITAEKSAGQLIIDGGAVWIRDNEYTRRTDFSDTFGTRAIFHDLSDPNSASYGKQYYYNNTGIVARNSMITNFGTLNLWPGVTMQNSASTDTFGTAINTAADARLNMYGGTITNCAAAGNLGDQGIGGAIYLGNRGPDYTVRYTPGSTVFNLYDGNVINNAVPAHCSGGSFGDGGGIAMDAAKMNMYGGDVSWNHAGVYYNGAAGDGGGIMVRCGSVLELYNGTISHNYAGGYGGGVVAWNGDVNIHGGAITQNFASYGAGIGIAANGGSVYSEVNMTGGTVAYNEAIVGGRDGGYGGGICAGSGNYTQSAHLSLSGGTIQQNKALYGGGLAVYASGNGSANAATPNTDIKLSGNFELTGNSANFNGNGMYVVNKSTSNRHPLVTLAGNAKIDTSNPVYFENLCKDQIPVLVNGKLETPGTAAIFEFSDQFWTNVSYSDYVGAQSSTAQNPLSIVQFSTDPKLDIQENKIAL